jgi:general secretion pathway protein D
MQTSQQHAITAWRLPVILAVGLMFTGCAAEQSRRDGLRLIESGQLDKGLARLEVAASDNPKNAELQLEYLKQRDQGINRLLDQAASARAQGNLTQAEVQLRHVLSLDGSNVKAVNGLRELETDRRHAVLFADLQQRRSKGDLVGAKEILRLILIERPNDSQANLLRYRLDEQTLAHDIAGPTLNIKNRQPVTLQFRDANLKMVLEAISRATGINILMDKDVRNDIKVTIFVKNSPVEEALDLILLQNQLEKRVIGENSVLIYGAVAAKQKEYQDLKVRRFVLTNADPKQVQTMLKTILRVRDLYIDEKTNSVVIRDTNDVIRLAEKLIASIDQPEAEVMLEVQLMDLDRRKTLELGVDWPNMVTWVYPVAAAGQTLSEIRKLASTVSFSPNLGATLRALENDGDTRVLATPRIRSRSKEKARIMIGNRTPIISTAAVPSTGGIGSAAVYNTNIQYLDTGIKLEVEPTVFIDGEVSIKINLEVSDLGTKYENTATGTLAYATTTNNAVTTLRLRDGETQVLAGLIRATTSNGGSQKVPGLGDIPLVGRLFGIQSDSWENRELVLAITPHIVRISQASDANLLELWSGTEANVRMDSSHKSTALPAGNVVTPTTTAAESAGAQRAPAPTPVEMMVPAEASAAQPLSPGVQGAVLGLQVKGPAQAKVGDTFVVALDVGSSGSDLSTISFALKYDMDKVRPIGVTEGSVSAKSGAKSVFQSNVDQSAGIVVASTQMEGASRATGAGTIATVEFQVLAEGLTAFYPTALSASGNDKKSFLIPKPAPLQITLTPK